MERWFIKRRKYKVLAIADRQMALALDTINDLERTIKAVYVDDKETVKTTIERLFSIEEEIDDLRRAVFEELTKGSLPSRERENIMRLVRNLDVMADHVKDSARGILVLLDENIPKGLWKAFHEMSLSLVKTAAVLRESLRNLGEDPYKARALSEKIEDEEKQVDKKNLEIKSLLLKYGVRTHDEINTSVLLFLKDLLDSMEEAADSCADTGDYIRVLTVTFK